MRPSKLLACLAALGLVFISGTPRGDQDLPGAPGPPPSPAAHEGGGAPHRLTVVKSRDIPPYDSALEGFLREIEARGGRVRTHVLTLEGGTSTVEEILRAVEASGPDLILTLGTSATRAVVESRPRAPILFSLVLLSNSHEFLDTARREGLNVTGTAMDVPVRLQFEKARELLPGMRRIGVFFNPRETGPLVEEAARVAAGLGLELVPMAVETETALQERLQAEWPPVDLLWSVADGTVFTPRTGKLILLETLRRQVPFIGLSPSFVKAGALISFSCNYEAVGAQAAQKAARILEGEPAGTIPVTGPGRVAYYLNSKTARKIGVEIPKEFLDGAEVVF